MDITANKLSCILFQSDRQIYILPKECLLEVMPLDKAAIFLNRHGWILGKQKYHSEIIPIVNLQDSVRNLLETTSPRLIVLQIIHPNQQELIRIAVLLDTEPEFLEIQKDDIALAGDVLNGTYVTVKDRQVMIPDLATVAEQIISSS